MAPIVDWVILGSDPVGVHEVNAIELLQVTVSTKISSWRMRARNIGTQKLVGHSGAQQATGGHRDAQQPAHARHRSSQGQAQAERAEVGAQNLRHPPASLGGGPEVGYSTTWARIWLIQPIHGACDGIDWPV